MEQLNIVELIENISNERFLCFRSIIRSGFFLSYNYYIPDVEYLFD